jgi:hypothetical protein
MEFVLRTTVPTVTRIKGKGKKEKMALDDLFSRWLKPEKRQQFELLLLERLKQRKADLEKMLGVMSGHWTYEDHFYRYYHGSFKVYHTQNTTEQAVKLLRELLPERELNSDFEKIINGGTGKEFNLRHNRNWGKHTRPMLEAFAHAKFMIEMAMRYADLPKPPQPLPSGYAALLYLYDLR